MAIAPHENCETRLVLGGRKLLAVIERSKDPYGFALAVSMSKAGSLVSEVKDGEIVITLPNNRFLIKYYHSLIEFGVHDYGLKEYHRKMGKLFGYTDQDIEDFITTEINCECTKCKGK